MMKAKLKNILRYDYWRRFRSKRKLRRTFNDAVAQNLFDLKWYEERYGKFANPLAAYEDYLTKSIFANVNPSATFDNESYLRTNLDIYYQGTSPLIHYLKYGKSENRRILPAHLRWHPKDELIATEASNWAQQKVAICLHIYYADFVDKFANCLTSFPMDVDVFVAVSNEDIKRQVELRYPVIAQVKNLSIIVAPNRGRNFGPLLVEFGKQLLAYDLMCHLHSKKSLYSGREQTQWFDYLNQYLFKDRHVVACLLRLFAEYPELGMYYPTSFWMMPSWVNHWTCNKPYAKAFVDEWQIDITNDFVNYPVGGMFWARPQALKQLFEVEYEYEHFPEEPLVNDGSWLHALERVLGLLVEKNQYKQFFYSPAAAKFTCDKSFIFSNYHKPPEQLFQELRNFDVISFDIFDTVIRREYTHPDFAKWQVGKELAKEQLVTGPQAFLTLRNDVELTLRRERQFKGDVSIEEVYQRIAKMLCCDPEQSKAWMQLEFSHDLSCIKPKDEMIHLVHQLNAIKREIWFVTDTYYTRAQIEYMLRKAGIGVPYKLFVSSELGLRKDAGTMWKMLKNQIDSCDVSHIHVGDNVRADAQICGDFGLANMHILHPVDKWQAAGFEPVFKHSESFDENNVNKWGRLVSNLGRYPFFGE
ncbi:rhamnan synthesis F family protein [Neptunicella sp. SCSIO 80796]|uniref:rhamnan synthesis F family protein n=1 Tax=Neptunicella plasticusilytica TaxID=3117012 RepID=UPI003A4D4535